MASSRDWIRKQMLGLSPVLGLKQYFDREPWIAIDGRKISVGIRFASSGRNYWIYQERHQQGLFQINDRSDPAISLIRLVRDVAKDFLEKRTRYWSEAYSLSVGRVCVRNQSTRWGSCSQSGCISLNWRLLLLSPGAQDYVILHELAHLVHLNHSAEFHNFLSSLDPKRSEHEAELEERGPLLMRVGRGLAT